MTDKAAPPPPSCEAWVQREPQALDMLPDKSLGRGYNRICGIEPLGGGEPARMEWIEA